MYSYTYIYICVWLETIFLRVFGSLEVAREKRCRPPASPPASRSAQALRETMSTAGRLKLEHDVYTNNMCYHAYYRDTYIHVCV